MRRLVALACLTLALSCSNKTPFRFPSDLDRHEKFRYDLDLDVFQLSNGLTVVLAPQRDTNVTVVDVRYKVGSAADPAGATGIAHFVEHLSFLERTEPGKATLWDRLAAASLSYNAFTVQDATDYVSIGVGSAWTEQLSVEAARMRLTCAAIDDDLFERERGVVLAELAQRGSAGVDPLYAALFGEDHPYGHNPGGSDVGTIKRDDVCKFLDLHYGPQNAVLVVSGAVDRKVMRTAIAATFGGIPAHGNKEQPYIPSLSFDERTGAQHDLSWTLDQPMVVLAYAAPDWGTNEAIYHQLAETLVQSAMNRVANAHDDIDAIFVFDVGGKRGGVTLVAALAKKGADLSAVEKAMRDGLPAALSHGRTDEILVSTWRAYLYAQTIGRYEDLSSRGDMIADYLQYTDRTDFQIHDLEVTHALTLPALLAYTDHYLVNAKPFVLRIRPEAKRDPKERTTSIANLATRTVKDLPISRQPVDAKEADSALVAPAAAHAEAPTEIMLDNGLRVVFAPRLGSSLFEARMVFPTGSADDPPDAPGTARLAAEKLSPDYKRTFDWDQWDQILAGTGVGTSYDEAVTESATVISTSGIAAWAQWHLWHLHLDLEAGVYDPEDLAGETGDNDNGDEAAAEQRHAVMSRLFGSDHPYARPTKKAAPDAARLEAFRRAHYVTEGATLIISGNFDRAVIEHDIRELWGAWPKRAPSDVHQVPAASPEPGPNVFAIEDGDATQIHVKLAVLAHSTLRASRPARAVAKELLDLRLAAIREEMAASYGVYASYHTTAAGDLLEISGDVDPARAGDAIARIVAELDQLRDHAADLRDDFVRARRAALSAAMVQQSSAAGAADQAQDLVIHELPLDYYVVLPSKIGAVSPDDVAALLHRDLDRARMVVVVSGPNARAAAEASKLAPVTVLPSAKK
ncbi:MAG TPA: insulinase family protein [Kofleriaceae bacterium]|nr:insulinase family protein [Kofleriaceae bacterium]